MSNRINGIRATFFRGLERIGQTASNLASNAHLKLDEINLESRRQEILSELPVKTMEVWKNGAQLPEEIASLMAELSQLDEQLTALHAQRYAGVSDGERAENGELADGEVSETEELTASDPTEQKSEVTEETDTEADSPEVVASEENSEKSE